MSNEQRVPTFQGMTVKRFTPPLKLSDFKLIAFDMDSTLIEAEVIDELARRAGVGEDEPDQQRLLFAGRAVFCGDTFIRIDRVQIRAVRPKQCATCRHVTGTAVSECFDQ